MAKKKKSNDNSFAITQQCIENLNIVSLLRALSAATAAATKWTEPDEECRHIASNQFVARLHSVHVVVLQQTYISCYLRCNFMFSRLLRILMFMFFLPFSSFPSCTILSPESRRKSNNEFEAVKRNMFHKRIRQRDRREEGIAVAIRQSAVQCILCWKSSRS